MTQKSKIIATIVALTILTSYNVSLCVKGKRKKKKRAKRQTTPRKKTSKKICCTHGLCAKLSKFYMNHCKNMYPKTEDGRSIGSNQ